MGLLEQKIDSLLAAYRQLQMENEQLRRELLSREETRKQLMESKQMLDSHLRTVLEEKKKLENSREVAAGRIRALISRLEAGGFTGLCEAVQSGSLSTGATLPEADHFLTGTEKADRSVGNIY